MAEKELYKVSILNDLGQTQIKILELTPKEIMDMVNSNEPCWTGAGEIIDVRKL